MKRGIGILAALIALGAIFAMVSCDNDTLGPKAGDPVVIKYDANGWEGSDVPAVDETGKVGTALTAAQLPTLTSTATQIFKGWSYTGNGSGGGGALVNTTAANAPKDTTVTLYVIWEAPAAVDTEVVIKYDANGWTGEGVPTADGAGKVGTAYTAAQLLPLTSTETQTYKGWSESSTGTLPLKAGTDSPKTATVTLYVIWVEGSSGGGGDDDDSNANLESLTLNGAAVNFGEGGSDYSAIPDDAVGSATVLSSTVIVVATPEVSDADVMFDKVTDSSEPVFWVDNEFNFASEGEYLLIEVTATDGATKKYYKIAITVADVALESLTVGGADVTLESPSVEWQSATAGAVLFDYPARTQPTGGLEIVATAAGDADIQYGHAVEDAEPVFSAVNTIRFVNGEFLYIKVSKGNASAYYKAAVNFQMEGIIKYGSPRVGTDEEKYIDPLWNDPSLDIYPITKPYLSDFSATGRRLLAQGRVATGIAKALWDEDGLYIYVVVTDPDVSTIPKEGSQAHETDSVELFVNEGDPLKLPDATGSATYTRGGSQYRVGANGERSGEGQGPAALEALNRTSAWKTDTGYIIIFQAPWRLRDRFPITDQKEIGFEIQINDAPGVGTRHAVMVWNNVAHTNYQNAADYGVAILDADGHTLAFPAVDPTIETQPQGAIVSGGESINLTVSATTTDEAGILTYQWYSADSLTADGTAIGGATSGTYTFNAPAANGRYYYYAIVTNTLTNAKGTTTAETKSAVATIYVSDVPMIEQLTLAQQNAIYSFTLPADATFGDYTAITVEYYMDATNFAKGVRSVRLMGNYLASDFSSSGNYMHFAFDAANAAYIYDDIGTAAITTAQGAADTWFTLTYRLTGNVPNNQFTHKPADDAVGAGEGGDEPFLFGVGIPGNSTASNATAAKVQLVKNITMVHKDDPTKNVTGEATNMLVGYSGNDGFNYSNREWVPDPDAE